MRALTCLDARGAIASFEGVAARAGLDTVIFDVAAGDDADVVQAASRTQLDVHVNLPLMFDPVYLRQNPGALATTSRGRPAVDDWLWYACPSNEGWWSQRLDVLRRQLSAFRPTGVSLDFARGFVFWERVPPPRPGSADEIEHGCCCDACAPTSLDPADAADARAHLVARRVREAVATARSVHPGIPVGLKVVPWLEADYGGARRRLAGQDLALLVEHVDVLMPMSYAQLIGRPAGYVHTLHKELRELTGRPLVPWLQAAAPGHPEPLPYADFDAMLTALESEGTEDYCVFHLEAVADRPDIISRLRRSLSADNAADESLALSTRRNRARPT